MIAVAMALGWASYTLMLWGYSLLKGYNISLVQLVNPVHQYTGQWPPHLAGNSTIIPDGTSKSETNATFESDTTSAATSSGSNAGVINAGAAGGGSSAAAISQGATKFGWGTGSQWQCLQSLLKDESGGNATARNPGSGAYGIAQALGHGCSGCSGCGRNEYGTDTGYGPSGLTAAQAAAANCGNAYYQVIWMMNYIKQRYGNPCAALNHENSSHWY